MAASEDRADENDEISFKDGNTDISQQLMDRYGKSSASQHRHLVATAVAMRSILTSESLPPSPPAFFAAAISSVDSSTEDPMAVSALLTFLSIVLPLVPSGEISATMARDAVAVLVNPIDGGVDKLGVASLRAGVKCIGTLLIGFCDLDHWESLQIGFGLLLKFAIDKRPKVRRCAQECLEKLFGSLQSSTVVKEASNTVYALLKEYKPVLSDLSSKKIDEGAKVDSTMRSEDAEAAHVLNVLSATIPFLSAKVSSRVFSELCKLMGSQFSPLTRQILKAIDTIFKNSEDTTVVPEIEGLVTSLTSYLSLHDKNPADTIVHVTTLLKSALEKAYSVEPTLCLKKLPLVCGSLAGLLTSTDDVASQASVILKDLISSHIDTNELLIEGSLSCEDEDNVTSGDDINAAMSVCSVFQSALNSCDGIPKEHILTVINLLIEKLGERSYILAKNIILKLADLMEHATGDMSSSQYLQQCIGSAVVAMGPVRLLELLPITLHAESHSCTNAWLIPVLRKYIIGASLEYYVDHIVPLAKSLMLASKGAKKSAHGKELRAYGHELLRLLPAFCNYPVDVHQQFGSLAKLMVKFIKNKSFMHEAVALSLQILVNQNKRMPKPSTDMDEATAISEDATTELESRFHYSKKASTKNMKALASSSTELLQTLVDVFTASDTEISADFKAAIGCLASTLDSSVRKKILISLLNKFDPAGESETEGKVNQSNDSIDEEKETCSATKTQLKRSAVLDLASSFVEGAQEDLIELIYNLVRQSFQATDEADLCGAYDTLSRVLQEHGSFCSSHFAEVIEMLLSHKTPEDAASSISRFACLHVLMAHGIQSSTEEENEKAFLILNEIILTLKDGKEEHRKAACDALVMVYTTLKNSSSISSDELCPKLINMITGYIDGSSPHIRSGAVSALSALIYKDPEICLSSPEILSSVLSLLHTKSIEIIKAVLGFVKVLVSTSQAQDLQSLLQNLLYEILPWSSVSRHYFKSKVTIIVEIMVRKCGTRAVQLATPDKHKSFIQTVLENRSGKSRDKEETNDSQTTSTDPSREPRKRNYREASSETTAKQDGNKFKRQKGTHQRHTPASDISGSRTGQQRYGNRSFGKHREASGNNHKSGKDTRKPQKNRFRKAQ
ncbi:PREDICTED: RRP12-like protein [Camelina sativa]|uniref:RRP12-like protein n=1 Tax=Camelina sativa TaxID=90675 RepID=A0ABM0UZT6_CAMSA|nr:PREDICTED: RRP12-like protein [Camelina sativa]